MSAVPAEPVLAVAWQLSRRDVSLLVYETATVAWVDRSASRLTLALSLLSERLSRLETQV
jgi:hypothetical protein